MLSSHVFKAMGFSLLEMMIAMSLSASAVLMTTSILASTTASFQKLQQVSRLQDELETVVYVMAQDIQNAEYDGKALIRSKLPMTAPSPFADSLSISSYNGEPDFSCITFSHDMNSDGELTQSSPNERRGYRLKQGAIEVRMAGNQCSANGWHDLTAGGLIVIDTLSFSVKNSSEGLIPHAGIEISVSAHLSSDKSVVRDITLIVPVKNV